MEAAFAARFGRLSRYAPSPSKSFFPYEGQRIFDFIIVGGNIKYSFSLEDDKSITITQDTVYPSIRWKTDVSFRLDDFDIAAVEAVCMDAIAFLEKLREHPCFMEYRIEE